MYIDHKIREGESFSDYWERVDRQKKEAREKYISNVKEKYKDNPILAFAMIRMNKDYIGGNRGESLDQSGYIHISHNRSGSRGIQPSSLLAIAMEYTIEYLKENPEVLKEILKDEQ